MYVVTRSLNCLVNHECCWYRWALCTSNEEIMYHFNRCERDYLYSISFCNCYCCYCCHCPFTNRWLCKTNIGTFDRVIWALFEISLLVINYNYLYVYCFNLANHDDARRQGPFGGIYFYIFLIGVDDSLLLVSPICTLGNRALNQYIQ